VLAALPPQDRERVSGPPHEFTGNLDALARQLSAGQEELVLEIRGIV